MTKSTVVKLAVLIILAFIVCLPEFFPPEVLQIKFNCSPFDPCDPKSGWGHYDLQQIYKNGSPRVPLPQCEAKITTNQDGAVNQYFVCETHADLRSLWTNASVSETDMDVMVTLQITAPPLLQNVSINGHLNKSGLHMETKHNITLIACCFLNSSTWQNKGSSSITQSSHRSNASKPAVFSAGPSDEGRKRSLGTNHTHQSNRSRCIFHLEDFRKMSSETERRWSVSTIVWLVLVLMVVLLVLLGVKDQVFKNRHCCKKKVIPDRVPVNHPNTFSIRRVKSLGDLPDDASAISTEDRELFLEKTPPDNSRAHVTSQQRRVSLASTERLLQAFRKSYRRDLSPIPELSVTDGSLRENEEEYDEDVRSVVIAGNAFLHHRSYPSLESCH
ncbi:uncharacterized protein si:dkey-192k22.2 [Silurus meridionalis]|uniref:uncharacterized protein si:dkey-192k22.2 n=1 Tax=Silurus meridionalis TaxID=175797 RepID=UPI001EEA93F1|nr:uncharacterized protein si:dkey-192k22.2 [Silurus meridionalis]